jgi:hypothetical protein
VLVGKVIVGRALDLIIQIKRCVLWKFMAIGVVCPAAVQTKSSVDVIVT